MGGQIPHYGFRKGDMVRWRRDIDLSPDDPRHGKLYQVTNNQRLDYQEGRARHGHETGVNITLGLYGDANPCGYFPRHELTKTTVLDFMAGV